MEALPRKASTANPRGPSSLDMGDRVQASALLFLCSLLCAQVCEAQTADRSGLQRAVRAPTQKFIRFGRAGQKFIRFGRSGARTWDILDDDDDIANLNSDMEKRAGAKFIRFG